MAASSHPPTPLAGEAARVGRFAAVGIAATLVHAATYLALVSAGLVSPAAANVTGFGLAFLLSLAGHYRWTFGDRTHALSRPGRRDAILRFTAVAGVGLLMNAAFVALVEAIGADPRLAVLFIAGVTPTATYVLSWQWAFPAAPGSRSVAARRVPAWLLPAFAIALVVPLLATSTTFGLPQDLDPDEMIFMGAALRMLSLGSLDPGWYGAPAQPLIYGLAALYAVWIVILDQLGIIHGVSDAARYYFADRSSFLAIGRLLTVLSATSCLVVMVAILREAHLRTTAILVAIALFAFSPLILCYSSIIRMDFQQILFNLLTSYFCFRAIRGGAIARNFLLAGLCVGVAVTSKFTGVAGAATVVAAGVCLVWNRRLRPLTGIGLVAAAGLASILGAFLTGPYLFLNFHGMLEAVANEARPTQLGATSSGFGSALTYYLTDAAPNALGLGAAVLAVVGAVLALRRPIGVVTLPFVVSYVSFISGLNLYWARWFLPVVPFAALLTAVAVDAALARFGRERRAATIVMGAAALLLSPTIAAGIEVARLRALDLDSRVQALAWIEANLPAGATVLLETDAPGISSREYRALIVESEAVVPWTDVEEHDRVTGYYTYFGMWAGSADDLVAAIRGAGVDYVLMSDWADRFEAEAAAYPRELAVYAAVRTAFPQVREFVPPAGWSGPTIRLLAAK